MIYQPHPYPFNQRHVTEYKTNLWKKYENILFTDKETLVNEPYPLKHEPTLSCIAIKNGSKIEKGCIKNFQ